MGIVINISALMLCKKGFEEFPPFFEPKLKKDSKCKKKSVAFFFIVKKEGRESGL
jgi:hypothetical protein